MIVLLQQPRQIGHVLKSWTGAKAAHVCSCVGFTKLSVLHRSVHFGSASTEKLAVMVIRKEKALHVNLPTRAEIHPGPGLQEGSAAAVAIPLVPILLDRLVSLLHCEYSANL